VSPRSSMRSIICPAAMSAFAPCLSISRLAARYIRHHCSVPNRPSGHASPSDRCAPRRAGRVRSKICPIGGLREFHRLGGPTDMRPDPCARFSTGTSGSEGAFTEPKPICVCWGLCLRDEQAILDESTAFGDLPPRPTHHKIRTPRAAFGAPQPACPRPHGCRRAVLFGQRRRVRLAAMQTRLAPDDQADPSRDDLAEG